MKFWISSSFLPQGQKLLSLAFCCRSLCLQPTTTTTTIRSFTSVLQGSSTTDYANYDNDSFLNIVILTGTTRTEGPPRPILGPRVASFIRQGLEGQFTLHDNNIKVNAIIDPFPTLLEKPHFAYAKSQVPSTLQETHKLLQQADAYVVITPEYNHAPSPGLVNVLNHFGSSVFSYKPSAIVTYSAGQWGGTRAAIGLRPILSELGCLPVSAMIHIPQAQSILDENGNVIGKDIQQEWASYCNRCFAQLAWWATACKNHRQKVDPFDTSPAFSKSPTQRNAPGDK